MIHFIPGIYVDIAVAQVLPCMQDFSNSYFTEFCSLHPTKAAIEFSASIDSGTMATLKD